MSRFKAGLKLGSNITGRVAQAIGTNQYVVSLRGMHLVAQSDSPLKKGQLFKARVQAVEPKLELKILKDGVTESLSREWGINEGDRHILDEMSAAKMPLDKENFDRVRDIVQRFKRNPNFKASREEITRAAVRLHQLGLPATEENFAVQLSIVKGDTLLARLLEKLMMMNLSEDSGVPAEVMKFLKSLPQQFSAENMVKNLPVLANLLGLMHESSLKSLLNNLKPGKEMNLKWALMLMQKAGLDSETVNKLGQHLEAMQFQNLPENRPGAGDNFILQIPVLFKGQWEEAWVKFNFGGNQKHLDKDNASIRIKLDSRNLGELSAAVDISGGAMIIGLDFQSEETADFVRKFSHELIEAVEGLGYNIKSLTVTGGRGNLNTEEDEMRFHPSEEGIDFLA
ncbi:flagellar hook-length control protein FliK [bacterium]|nr:flagellar hook-length control protein FliK [bacterium]